MAESFLFASGKGGVGKSVLSANLSVLLARSGSSVVLIDADLGLRAQDLMLGVENEVVYDLLDVVEGDCTLEQALLPVPSLSRLRLLPAAQFARVKDLDPRALKKILSRLRREADFIFVDCPAGMERGLRNVLNAGSSLSPILVVTPDDLCLRDAERVAALLEEKKLPQARILVNRLQPDLVHAGIMYSAQTVSQVLDLPLLGEVPEDPAFCLALLRRRYAVDYVCEAEKALTRIVARLRGEDRPFPSYGQRRTSFLRRHFSSSPREVKRYS